MITDDRMMTSIPGLFAAGDVRAQLTRQITTAVGDATTAAIAVEKYLTERRSRAASQGQSRCLISRWCRCPTGSCPRTATWWRIAGPGRRCIIDPGEEPADVPRRARHPGLDAARHLADPRPRGSHHRGRRGEAGHRGPDPSAPARPPDLRRAAAIRRLARQELEVPPPPDVALAAGDRLSVGASSSRCAPPRAIRPAA